MTESAPTGSISVEFDHYDRESADNPFPRWERMRHQSPVAWSEKNGGYYVLTRYSDIMAAVRDPQAFSSQLAGVTIPRKPVPNLPPIEFDPPEHEVYRRIIGPLFAPDKVAENRPWIREIADSYTQRLLKQDAFDASTDLAANVTQDVTQRLLGITQAPDDVKRCTEDLVLMRGSAEAAGKRLLELLTLEIDKRRGARGDDIISTLLTATFDGERPLRSDEIVNTALFVLLAGLDTTTSAIGGSIWYLLKHPEAQAELAQADDRKWRLALDELVRWTSPAQSTCRTVRDDTELASCPMQAGKRVLLLIGSGNRDETEFADPDRVVLERFPNRHMGFGMGVHRCLGSHLAKAIMEDVLRGLLAGLADFEIESDAAVRWEASNVRGIRRLPLVRKRRP